MIILLWGRLIVAPTNGVAEYLQHDEMNLDFALPYQRLEEAPAPASAAA